MPDKLIGEKHPFAPARAGKKPDGSELRDHEIFCDTVTSISSSLNHEVDSPLASIIGNAQFLLLTSPGNDPEVRKKLRAIEQAAFLIKQTIERVGKIARPVYANGPAEFKLLDLEESTKE